MFDVHADVNRRGRSCLGHSCLHDEHLVNPQHATTTTYYGFNTKQQHAERVYDGEPRNSGEGITGRRFFHLR